LVVVRKKKDKEEMVAVREVAKAVDDKQRANNSRC
jgi:hypothetical protein